jgi:hypothetical protein
MTEVREDKEKSQSGNESEGANNKLNGEKEVLEEDLQNEARTCELCGRNFKNERALKTHQRHCEKKQGGEKAQTPGHSDFDRLKEELFNEMETIKAERTKLMNEKEAFLDEMRQERDKLREEMGTQYKNAGSEVESHMGPKASENSDLNEEIEGIERELEGFSNGDEGELEGTIQMDLDELTTELENLESEISTKVDFGAMKKMADDFGLTIKSVEDNIHGLTNKIDSMNQELAESGRKYGTYQHIIREMKKLDEKNEEILEEIGFGESMNVSKIPPKILESVYETTIEDIVTEIRKNQGSHDAEAIVNRTLEDIRTRTSGSELFYFDGRMLKTRNLANSILHKLISAKQVQTTYDELLSKLLEYLPGYKAKNFRAMIKLKSQEYAVDKSTLLLERFNQLKEDINHLQNMVGSVSNRQNTIELEINNLTKSMVGAADLERFTKQMEEFSGKIGGFDETLSKLKEEQNAQSESLTSQLESISNRISELEKNLAKIEVRPKVKPIKGVVELGVDEEEKEEEKGQETGKETETLKEKDFELTSDENNIYSLISENGYTFFRIKKEIKGKISEKNIKKCLESLLVKGVLTTEKRGRHTVYIKTIENGGEK